MSTPKYARPEIERRMLVRPDRLPDLGGLPCTVIEDRYFEAGRLRLRKMTGPAATDVVYKLGKKYGAIGAYEEPIVNIYLSAAEYDLLRVLPGHDLVKRRYRFEHAGHVFAIDEHGGVLAGLYLCEREAALVADLLAVPFPPFAGRDVTGDARFSGASLARAQQRPSVDD